MKKQVCIAFALSFATASYAESKASEIVALKEYCQPDVERLCPGIEYANGNVKACLKANEKEISVGCAEALKGLKEN